MDKITANQEDLKTTFGPIKSNNSFTYIHIVDNNGKEHKYRLSDVIDALLTLLKEVPEVD